MDGGRRGREAARRTSSEVSLPGAVFGSDWVQTRGHNGRQPAEHRIELRSPTEEEWALLAAAAPDRVCADFRLHLGITDEAPAENEPWPIHRPAEEDVLGAWQVLALTAGLGAADTARLAALAPAWRIEAGARDHNAEGLLLSDANDLLAASLLLRAHRADLAVPALRGWLEAGIDEERDWRALADGVPESWVHAARRARR